MSSAGAETWDVALFSVSAPGEVPYFTLKFLAPDGFVQFKVTCVLPAVALLRVGGDKVGAAPEGVTKIQRPKIHEIKWIKANLTLRKFNLRLRVITLLCIR